MADDRDFKTEDFTNPVCNSNELPGKFIEFVEWIPAHMDNLLLWASKDPDISYPIYWKIEIDGDHYEMTTQQLYEYWLKNIKNK